jgi:alkanesulfonate monooxygenase SsuD/methylene tetrahydromethanopterin reductase-like flavin-dependent oxidoreductase (luciferase family)
MLSRSYVGSADAVRAGLEGVLAETGADELIVAAAIHDHAARIRSYEILAEIRPAFHQRARAPARRPATGR